MKLSPLTKKNTYVSTKQRRLISIFSFYHHHDVEHKAPCGCYSSQIKFSFNMSQLCAHLGTVAASDLRELLQLNLDNILRWGGTSSNLSFTLWNPPAVWLHASRGPADSPAVPQHTSHTLAHGHHLGWRQPPEGLPAQHAGPALHAGVEVGFFHQSQRHRLPHQVGQQEQRPEY